MASVIFSQAGGKVFASDGKASEQIHNQEVYALKDITTEIANKMPLYFYDFTGNVTTAGKGSLFLGQQLLYGSNGNNEISRDE
ncbi:hypothetical protein [Gallintestinimicrobium sp.]|uniref:hypothetical protein n=1 Tax=Gallintestinimicrobium sp. TaxID=2981655 RepID=UPI0039947B2B